MLSMPNSVAPPPPSDPLARSIPTEPEDVDPKPSLATGTTPLALGAIAGVAAVVILAFALTGGGGHQATGAMSMPMSPAVIAPVAGPAASMPLPGRMPMIRLSVAGANKLGPDGKMHDSFTQTDFAVKVGQPVLLRIHNADSAPHSITAPATGVSITVLPGTHTYSLVATTAGRFEWFCVLPCDPWSMTHPGYMAGYITAT
jgi:heme/copper-type cytochrome/quinol oxidase subunit 2